MFAYPCFEEFFSLYLIRISFAANCFHCLSPFCCASTRKAYSVTIHHNFGKSNDICPSPFLIKAEQTSHSSALVCHAFLPSSTGLTALCQGPPYSRKTQMGYSTPASNCDIPSQLPKRGEQSFPSTCWIILLLTQPCVETWKRTALYHSYDQRNRSAKDPLPEWWGDSSLLLGEPSSSAPPHPSLCNWCCPQGVKLGNTYLIAKGSMWKIAPHCLNSGT